MPSQHLLHRLQLYDGRDPRKPLLLAIKGVVLDVTTGRDYYGEGCSYHVFAGRHARWATPYAHMLIMFSVIAP